MPIHAVKPQEHESRAPGAAPAKNAAAPSFQFADNRPEAAVQLALQALADQSPRARSFAATSQLARSRHAAATPSMASRAVTQLVLKNGPGGTQIDVEEDADYLPACFDAEGVDVIRHWVFYKRPGASIAAWNDTDFFYADRDGAGDLVQITSAVIHGYFDRKHPDFARTGGVDTTKNCQDYATEGQVGTHANDFGDARTLTHYLGQLAIGHYVVKKGSFHWLRLQKTGADAFTIRQKDGESAIYSKNFDLAGASAYISQLAGTLYTVAALDPPPPAPAEGDAAPAAVADVAAVHGN